jgi:hypothetical protein
MQLPDIFTIHLHYHESSVLYLVPSAMPLRGDDIMQGLQSGSTLAHNDELVGALECILRLLEYGSTVVS